MKAREKTPWAVNCPSHGKVFLTEAEYDQQMARPDATWRCPCGQEAKFDDENFDAHEPEGWVE